MEKSVIVLILRGDKLEPNEIKQLQEKFQGRKLEFKSSFPKDFMEHAETCRKIKPDVVILPKDRPIPAVAMEEGFAHVVLTKDEVKELLPLQPQFKPFIPKK
ncbi:MAG: hypothetical protein G01um101418_786 [Parcubacteria group bacterium Gr01-1014_18]|nr:MAG: hypothetical protein Greene041636_745 [Parcubacteria group bacterium Greene0416_36]TSC80151.1 MAG: hypothetical protein G01um101418_786 [Parcubacteria group bacterium Gr01-1014_18]TSC99365.1 MAG: hypothetical protein Greene101420_293 [Parcubacteria group bacterium Greene1014_20]TSD06799.1 MAG: hypothetical protein Greene07142_533 [Parcubacteria group bacterium Greene0714_2]